MNRSNPLLYAGFLAAATPLLAAEIPAKIDLSKLPPASAKTGVTYANDIKPIFETTCLRCHGEERHRGGLRLDSLGAALKGGDDGAVIVPGKSKDSLLVVAVAQLDDETAMPPKPGAGRGGGGPGGGFGVGPGGRGGGFGPGSMLARQMVTQGDSDKDQKLSKAEFSKLAETWFDKLDRDRTGKLTQEQFSERLGDVLPAPQRQGGGPGPGAGPGDGPGSAGAQAGRPPGGQDGPGGPGGPPGGGRGGFGPGRFIGPGLFAATDTDKDGSVTRAEFKATFEKWFTQWDTEKSGALGEDKIREGLNATLPRPDFGGQGGFAGGGRGPQGGQGGPGGPGGPPAAGAGGPPPGGGGFGGAGGPGGQGGPGGGGGFGPPPKPLTAEQVGLIRAWIDQGAK
jgi:hypothetical protein